MLRDAVSQNFERILIFEDDLNFVPDFNERMTDVIATLKGEDWSMFYGSYAMEPPPQPIAGKALIQIKSTDSIRNSDFVSFRGPAIRQTVSYLETLMSRPAGDPAGGPMHVDGAYGRLRYEFPSIKTMLAAPPLGYQRSSRTDIHPLRWFDRTPVVRQTIGLLRKLRNKK
jgi:GR25 family glycosyltransferase involved in LPS biosynthesis